MPPKKAQTPHADPAVTRIAECLEQNAERLRRTLRKQLLQTGLASGSFATQEAIELFSLLVAKALEIAPRFEEGRRPLPWLAGIANNLVKQWQDKTIRRRKQQTLACELPRRADEAGNAMSDQEVFDLACAAAGQVADGPEKQALAYAEVEARMARLSKDDRVIVQQIVLEGRTAESVAAEWNITPGTARQRLHRALNRLRAAEAGDTMRGSQENA